ncbi:hypothetical protein [Streptomyces sp. NPDC002265]|uniref:hypothetical protein n=1 Tax=Streptomyces sp. NPDC002265 TaxID=3154415 RepID=UPI00331BCE77
MSENPEKSGTPETSEAVEGTLGETAVGSVAGKAARRVRPGRIAAVAGSVLLACALVGGVGYTVVTVQDADRDPGKPTWKNPAPAAGDDKDAKGGGSGKSGAGLSALFLPFGTDDYQPGPDNGKFGYDAEFGEAQANALRKESIKGLPSATRRELEKAIDRERIQGTAMRSYVRLRAFSSDWHTFTIDVTLSRLANPDAVRRQVTSFNTFLGATDVFRKGPKIAGHKDAGCYLTPKGKGEDLGRAFCAGYVGDVVVNATVVSQDPIPGKPVAEFFTAQLDRIDDPGQAV